MVLLVPVLTAAASAAAASSGEGKACCPGDAEVSNSTATIAPRLTEAARRDRFEHDHGKTSDGVGIFAPPASQSLCVRSFKPSFS